MEKRNVVLEKSRRFAVRMVRLYRYLREEKREFVLSAQMVRAATSIGANVEEAMGAASRRDFRFKLNIALKEAREARYWLTLLRDSELLEQQPADVLQRDSEELLRLLTAILKTLNATMDN